MAISITSAIRMVAAALVMSIVSVGLATAATLNLHNGGDPTSLDPHKVSGDWENRIVGDIFEGLLTEDVHAQAIPGQAESWTISEDGTVYTFKLRDDAVWSDGTPVTANDFVYAFQRIMNPETAAEYAYLQFTIKNAEEINSGEITDLGALGIRAVDDKTLEITLENPAPFFLTALTHYTAFPIPKHVVEEKGSDWVKIDNIVVNGPYRPVEWIPGSHVTTVKNESYYDVDSLQIDGVKFFVLEDEAAALRRYRAGEFDILTDFPKDQYQWLQDNHPGEARVAPFAGLHYYVFNQRKPPFDDARVRQALSMAINREVIGPQILGTGEPPAYSWVPPGMANYGAPAEGDWKALSYPDKIAKAKELLAEAGYGPDNPLKIVLRYNTNDNHKRVAIAIAAMWKALGVQTELFNSETKVHYADIRKGDFDVARAGWLADYNDAVNFLELLKGGIENNYGAYQNEEFDALLDQAARETDLDKRAELLHQAETIALGEAAAAPIMYYLSENVVSPKIGGFEDNAFDIHRTRWLTKAE